MTEMRQPRQKRGIMKNEPRAAADIPGSPVARLLHAVFPRVPDFNRLLNDQCDLTVRAMVALEAYMGTGDEAVAAEVRRLEREGDGLKARNIDTLNRSFSTPYDREDIYRAIIAIDDSVNYAKTTVREMEILEVSSDLHTLEMAGLLRQGAMALRAGFAKLKLGISEAEQDADAVRKAERQVEEAYRRALAELFDMERYLRDRAKRHEAAAKELATPNETTERRDCPADVAGLSFVLEALKRREIYRHLSNASDRIAFAADILHDIVVKSS